MITKKSHSHASSGLRTPPVMLPLSIQGSTYYNFAQRQDQWKKAIGVDLLVYIVAYKRSRIYNIPWIRQRRTCYFKAAAFCLNHGVIKNRIRMFSQASCKLSFPPPPLAHAFSWGSLLSASLLASFIVRMPMGQVLLSYSYFEKGCRIKCTRQPRKVLWAVLSHFFSKKFERMAEEAVDIYLRVLKESNKSRFDSYSVRNSVLNISLD